MAFNFNWSPLTADASFYTRAQELLTTALNKSPKPPIIVDDILVNELNLGSVPPDLEILEVGDLAEDRFRGIFKMCYTGDAFLTLKTKVQANPLNTYLHTKPSFTSPQPLAAASGLTIPLQITLSEIKLSAFIILVFSKQKGLTLVFRNDPLESLKVSSTFDSIPFVREYLQKEIEGQLRTLLMDEVPAIIHRLSLRLWVPEYRAKEDEELSSKSEKSTKVETTMDPLASPPQNPVDFAGNILDPSQIASLSLDPGTETQSLFSQKNLLRLAALTDSHRTLSLFTPSIRDVVFRAWAGPTERGESSGSNVPVTPMTPAISRTHSYIGGTGTTYVFPGSSDAGPHSTRPTLSTFGSAATGLSLGTNKHGKTNTGRKRKHRVVNLRRKNPVTDEFESISGGTSISGTVSSTASDIGNPFPHQEERDDELVTPPNSPPRKVRFQKNQDGTDNCDTTPRSEELTPHQRRVNITAPSPLSSDPLFTAGHSTTPSPLRRPTLRPTPYLHSSHYPSEKLQPASSSSSHAPTQYPYSLSPQLDAAPGGILEQAWMLKMASEIARKVHEEKTADRGFWERGESEDAPPPAYGV